MKVVIKFLLFALPGLLFTNCEWIFREDDPNPEEQFDLSVIPGRYEGSTRIGYIVEDTSLVGLLQTRTIHAYDHFIDIRELGEKQYEISYDPVDTVLPNKITVRITGFSQHGYKEPQANLEVLDNNLWSDTVTQTFYSGMDNYLRYDILLQRIYCDLFLKCIQDNIILDSGWSKRLD